MKKSKSNVVIVIIHQIYYLELTRPGSYREREKGRQKDGRKERERDVILRAIIYSSVQATAQQII